MHVKRRLLAAARTVAGATVLEVDPDQMGTLRKMGHHVFSGDASKLDLSRAARAEMARVLVIAIDDPEHILGSVETAKRHFLDLTLLCRAASRVHAYELTGAGPTGKQWRAH